MLTKHVGFVSDVVEPFGVKHNVVIFGRRDLGKTSFLFDCFLRLSQTFDGKIIVIDSATEHKEKSLLEKIKRHYDKSNFIGSFELWRNDVPVFLNENNCVKNEKVFLIDASKFLEDSFRIKDKRKSVIAREKYRIFVESCITAIKASINKFVIFMDEIELTHDAANALNHIKEGCAFFSIIHDISYVEGLKNFILINADGLLLEHFNMVTKSLKQVCGNACAEIVSALFYTKDGHTNLELFWCTDIAYYLAKNGILNEVLCWNSNLYNDYIKYYNSGFGGFHSLKRYEDNMQPVLQEPLTYKRLLFEINNSKCIICCVSSNSFNNNSSIEGGHYIVVYKDNGIYYCLTPKKNHILREVRDLEQIVNSCSDFGSWRILCK